MKGEPIQVVEKLLIYASGQIFDLYFFYQENSIGRTKLTLCASNSLTEGCHR